MKKLLNVLAYALALNFLAAVGGAGYLWRTGHLDRGRATAIKAILFPVPPPVTVATGDMPATQPSTEFDDMLKKAAGLTAEEQVQFLQNSFDSRMAELDLRQRQLADQQRQIDFGRQRLETDRTALDAEKQKFETTQQQLANQANDQGFQDSLTLYSNMPAKQVKAIFLGLDDDIVMRYLEAMPPRSASKIIKEFKTPDETDRIQKVLERMRTENAGGATTEPSPSPTAQLPSGGP
jgi:flagellar motility protein MotE (MotC chaperone)